MKYNKNQVLEVLQNLDDSQLEAVAADVLEKMNEKGMSLKEATGVSEESLEEMYALAYGYYNQGKFEEAVSLFKFLSIASPDTYRYVLGMAASFHQLKSYKEAATGFYLALNLEPNPFAGYYLLDAFLKQDLFDEAREFIDLLLELCEEQPGYEEIQGRVELIKKSLNDKKKLEK
ncbi:MAG: Chaperone protein IpgC [Chlamydiae bacterium]|nr:Chaperone protein IpgC [Chlamydiota bacterium]